MLYFATAFQTYRNVIAGKKLKADCMSQMPPNGGLPSLHNEHFTKNYENYCITYDTLLYHDFKPSPVPQLNDQITVKIAQVIFCSDTRAGDRSVSSDLIRKPRRMFKYNRKRQWNKAAEQAVTSFSISRIMPDRTSERLYKKNRQRIGKEFGTKSIAIFLERLPCNYL